MKDNCIFCQIFKGEMFSNKIYENDNFFVILDAFPSVKGQTLIIPKKHISYIFDLDDKEYAELLLLSKRVAKAIDRSLNPIKTGILVEGLEVDHVHVKLFPLDKKGFGLEPLIPKLSDAEMQNISEKIKKSLK